jgi:2-phospho-L-lactate guanylyltransferase
LGAGAVLVMPADVPLVKVHEVETLADAARVQGSVALVPSSDGGTNALLVRPPLGVPFLFGAESMVRHQVVAQERGLMVSIVRLAGLGLDVDRPEDLAWLAERQGSSAAQRLARSFGLVARPVCCEC